MSRSHEQPGVGATPAADDDSPAPSHVTDDRALSELLAAVAAAPALPIEVPRLAPGTIIDDSYRIEDPLGRGGMGQVYGALDLELGRRVAIKLHLAADRHHARRLLREAQTMAQLGHPNIITVHEVGRVGDHVFVVMELAGAGSARAWLARSPRTPTEILELYRQAGAGLAAAHRAQLVHRDFKPDNVLVHDDGRVCVADFGLVQIESSSELARPRPPVPDSRRQAPTTPDPAASILTAAGTTMGTPAYMAPEQMKGAVVDARADQFSFCVALHEALLGTHPFAGLRGPARLAAIAAQRFTSLDRPRGVSRRVQAAIARGLRSRPADRFSDVDTLLAALAPPRASAFTIAVAGTVATASIAAGVGWSLSPSVASCTPTDDRVAQVWGPQQQQRLQEATLASGTPHAAATWTLAHDEIDAYLRQWSEVHEHACSDASPPGTAREQQRACLDETLAHVSEALEVLAQGDPAMADATMPALYGLPPLIECSDPERLQERAQLRARPEQQRQVAELRRDFSRLRALESAGQFDTALSRARTVAQRAHDLGHRPTIAEALLLLGRMGSRDPASAAQTIETLTQAYWEAEAAGVDIVRAEAASQLVYFVGLGQGRYDDAMTWGRHGRAVVEHLGARGAAEGGSLYDSLGMLHQQRGQPEQAEAHLRHAIELKTRAHGHHHPHTAASRLNLAKVLARSGHYAQAEPLVQEVYDLYRELFGPQHPGVGLVLIELGRIHEHRGHDDRALHAFEQVLALWEAVRGPQHPRLIRSLTAIGRVHNRNGRHDEALSAYRRARALAERAWGAEHLDTAWTVLNEGEVYLASGQLDLALERFELALSRVRGQSGHDSVVEVEFSTCLAEARLALGDRAGATAEATAAWQRCEQHGCEPSLRSRAAFALARATELQPGGRARRLAERALADLPADDQAHRQRRQHIERWLSAPR